MYLSEMLCGIINYIHSKNGIVKVTNVLVSAVARIYQLVGCSGYVHLTRSLELKFLNWNDSIIFHF